jgi:tetratricopeptide (TPR) repeat protein
MSAQPLPPQIAYRLFLPPLVLLGLLLVPEAATGGLDWKFLPVGQDGRSNYSRNGLDLSKWQGTRFPHREFDKLQLEDNVCGWYRCSLQLPKAAQGCDLLFNLGIVDDVDVPYFNGVQVGRMGSATQFVSAWNRHRRILIPSSLLRPGQENVIAVQVFDRGGIGGILSVPHIGLCLPSTRTVRSEADETESGLEFRHASWHTKWLGEDSKTDLSNLDVSSVADPEKDMVTDQARKEGWESLALPNPAWNQAEGKRVGYRWYVSGFALNPSFREEPGKGPFVPLDVGPAHEAAIVFLNGKQIGELGRMPPEFVSAAGHDGLLLVPASLFDWDGTNVLAVKGYHVNGIGGLVQPPTIRLGVPANLEQAGKSDPQEALTFVAALLRSGHAAEAVKLTQDLVRQGFKEGVAGERDRARYLTLARGYLGAGMACCGDWAGAARVLQDALKWGSFGTVPPEAILTLQDIYERCLHSGAEKALPMANLFPKHVVYLGRDDETQGDWNARYGTAYILCGMASPFDYTKGLERDEQYWPKTGEPLETKGTRAWVQSLNTNDKRALVNPVDGGRRFSGWDDYGETHPFDNLGPDLFLSVCVPPGPHTVSLYLSDWNWGETEHPLNLGLTVWEIGSPLPIPVMVGWMGEGVYHRFIGSGTTHFLVRVHKLQSVCAGLSGVFIDRAHALEPLPFGLSYKTPPPKCEQAFEGIQRLSELAQRDIFLYHKNLRQFDDVLDGLGKFTLEGKDTSGWPIERDRLIQVCWTRYQALRQLGRWREADEAHQSFLKEVTSYYEPGSHPRILSLCAKACFQSGDFRAGMRATDALLQQVQKPEHKDEARKLLTGLIVQNSSREKAPVALAAFRVLERVAEGNLTPTDRVCYARLLKDSGESKKAAEILKPVREAPDVPAPVRTPAMWDLLQLQGHTGDSEEEITRTYRKLLEVIPDDEGQRRMAHKDYALCFYEQKKDDLAKKLLDEYIRRYGPDAYVSHVLKEIEKRSGKRDKKP